MTLSRFFRPVLMLGVLLCLSSATMLAQGSVAPSQQFGVGVSTGGLSLSYAISPAIQIAMGARPLMLTGENGSTSIVGGLSARLLLEGIVNPTLSAGFVISSAENMLATAGISAGLAYYLNRNVGVTGSLLLVAIPLESGSSGQLSSATSQGSIGLEWWFNR